MTAFIGAAVGTFLGWLGAAALSAWANNRLRSREIRNAELVAAAILSMRSEPIRPPTDPRDPKEVN